MDLIVSKDVAEVNDIAPSRVGNPFVIRREVNGPVRGTITTPSDQTYSALMAHLGPVRAQETVLKGFPAKETSSVSSSILTFDKDDPTSNSRTIPSDPANVKTFPFRLNLPGSRKHVSFLLVFLASPPIQETRYLRNAESCTRRAESSGWEGTWTPS